MYTRCPKCNKEMDESLDICPNCKHDFTKQAIKGSGRRVGSLDAGTAAPKDKEPAKPAKKGEPDLPAHMLADINAPPKSEKEESVLPPHMLGDAAGTEADLIAEMNRPLPVVKKSGSPVLYMIIGAVVVGAFAYPKMMKKSEPAPAQPAVNVAMPEPAPAPEVPIPGDPTLQPAQPAQEPAPPQPEPVKIEVTKVEEEPPAIDDGKPAAKKKKKAAKKTVVAQAPEPEQAAEPEPPAASSKKSEKWRVKGKVLNLITMEPVADATLTYTDPSGKTIRTATGANGNFRLTLSGVSGGYQLAISHPEYDSKYLPESGHKGMGEDQRKSIAEGLVQAYPKNPAIAPSGDSLEQDYVLLPRPKHGMSLEEALAK